MEPKIIEKLELNIVGKDSTANTVNEMNICSYWNDFEQYSRLIKNSNKDICYEIHFDDEEKHHCLIGLEVNKLEDIPVELVAKILPKSKYAVFTHSFKNGGFGAVNARIEDWLKTSKYEALPYEIQAYDSRFKGPDNSESELDYWIPVKEKKI